MAKPAKAPARGTAAMRTAEAVLTPAAAAENEARQFLSQENPSINYKTGLLKGTPSSFWKGVQQRGDCSLPPRGQNPMFNPKAPLDAYYKFEQSFAVNQPLVSWPLPLICALQLAAAAPYTPCSNSSKYHTRFLMRRMWLTPDMHWLVEDELVED